MEYNLINDEFPSCPRCGYDHWNDGPVCLSCQQQDDIAAGRDGTRAKEQYEADIRITDGGPQHHDLASERMEAQ